MGSEIADLLQNYRDLSELKIRVEGIVLERDTLRAQLAAARAERDAYKRQCDSLINDVISEAETQMARDARMKALGAAEWLEAAAREGGYYERSSEGMREEAAQLRQQAEAKRLAEGE